MKKVVISLGGSIVVPDKLDNKFIGDFRDLILDFSDQYGFIIVTGGGKTTRSYQNIARLLGDTRKDDLDWIGIYATRLNALLLKSVFGKSAHKTILSNPKTIDTEKIVFSGGWKPGWSTDFVSVKFAEYNKIDTVVNLSDVYCIYNKDPGKHSSAKPIGRAHGSHYEANYKQLKQVVGTRWDPGMNTPFDPVATKAAEKAGLKIIFTKGNDINNLKKLLEGKDFKGTTIS